LLHAFEAGSAEFNVEFNVIFMRLHPVGWYNLARKKCRTVQALQNKK